ncbi:hypothetical protein M9Y10_029189 [Tritrichomonas musculus]|uniref:Uncharacterized protein n=1 Tax=Tritrichomonas musculus TaxID=1915356 RepID=A0ABR2KLF3_9EUKA
MITEREWIARCCSLAQTEHDILRQLQNSFNRCGDSLSREERDLLNTFTSVFKPTDRSFLQQFHSETTGITNIRPHDRGFKQRLDHLEKDIIALRVSSAAELEKANGDIRKIIDDIDKREKRIVDLQTPAIRPKQTDIEFDSPVSEFQTFLAKNGGRTGGWDTESHAEFLRQLQRHGELDLPSHLPNIPEESVLAHLEWNKKFIELKQRMKAAINEMKEQNKKGRQNIEEEAPKSPKVDPEAVKLRLQERERMRQQRAKQAADEREKARIANEEIKKKKFQQLKQELMRKSNRKPSPIVETDVDNNKVVMRQDPRKQKFKSSDWEKIRKRDAEAEEKKLAIKQLQEEQRIAREEKERKLAEANAKKFRHAKRDPERLMKPTAAVLARKNADDDEPKGPVNSIFAIPHRAVPAWMA